MSQCGPIMGCIGTVHGVNSCTAFKSVPVWAIMGCIGTVHGVNSCTAFKSVPVWATVGLCWDSAWHKFMYGS